MGYRRKLRMAAAFLSTLASLFGAASAEVPEAWLESPLALQFGSPPTIGKPMLSPEGTHIVFLTQNPAGVTMLQSLDLADASVRTLLQGSEDGYDIFWCDFANRTRLICDLREGLPPRLDPLIIFGCGTVADWGVNCRIYGRSINYQRLYTLNLDGTELVEMQPGTGCTDYDSRRDTPPIDRIPGDEEHILFICGPSANLVGVDFRQSSSLDGAGEVAYPQTLYGNGHGLPSLARGVSQNVERWYFRSSIGDSWEAFLRMDRHSFEQRFRPVGFGTSLDHVFNFGWDDERGGWSLFRQSLTGDFENRLVFSHDVLDLELVDTMGAHDRVVSVAYLEDHSRRAIIDSRVAEVYRYAAELLPDLHIEILDESWDQNRYLARARVPGFAGELILVDMQSQTVQAIAPEYDHLTGFPLARTRLLEIEGADGGRFAAHLTLPQNFAEAAVPAVIMPRTRPSHEDIADPHYLVQYLAASGYAVLRVQNRVDAEFGTGWSPERAVVGWRQTASDIRAGVNFLVENGIAAEGAFCGAGRGYAAYAALISAVEDTDLFRCVIGISPLTDPRLTPGAEIIRSDIAGSSDKILEDASPIQRAREMQAAVLLLHGEADPVFDMADNTVALTNMLDRADKTVQFIQYPLAQHEIRRAPYRVDMLTRIGRFLDQQIGPSPAAVGINILAAGDAEDPGAGSP